MEKHFLEKLFINFKVWNNNGTDQEQVNWANPLVWIIFITYPITFWVIVLAEAAEQKKKFRNEQKQKYVIEKRSHNLWDVIYMAKDKQPYKIATIRKFHNSKFVTIDNNCFPIGKISEKSFELCLFRVKKQMEYFLNQF